jgi:glycosyltransferase involved in cell wall biosynthesis
LDGKKWSELMPENEHRKKIMILADWYEPGYKAGGPIQSVRNFVSAMKSAYLISILTTDTDLGELKPYPNIPVNQWIDKQPGLRIYYASRKLLRGKLLMDLINQERPDFIYLNSMYSVRFSILPLTLLWRKKINAQIVLSPRGMLRESAIKSKSTRKKLFISMLNGSGIPKKIRFHATDEQEQKDIRHYFPGAGQVNLISNFSAELPSGISPIKKTVGSLRCVFISRIMAIKNIQFFLGLLGQIPDSFQFELEIYGEVEDEPYWQEAQKMIEQLPAHIKVSYQGPLPHAEVIKTMGEFHLFVLPTTGENFGHAIFEALSAGRPVLISDRTPWHQLRNQLAGWDLPLENPKAWLNALTEAAEWDQEAFDRWSRASRAFAARHVEQFNLKQAYSVLFT